MVSTSHQSGLDHEIQKEIDALKYINFDEDDNLLDQTDPSWIRDIDLDDPADKSKSRIVLQLDENAGGIDHNTTDHWIFPVNYEKRDYQLNISRSAILHNTLVILPTGLGKTFIASVAIYNFMRFFPKSKIIFMAPTRPLVHQQLSACYNVVGISKHVTAELTGRIKKESRIKLWESKRLFFCTPQVLQNDLNENTFPAKEIKLVIFDEAHKAKKNHSYCQVIRAITESQNQFRVLALTATAGSTSEVTEIIQNLLISKIEYRSEESVDVARYTFKKSFQIVEIKFTDELKNIINKFNEAIGPYVQKLKDANVLKTHNLSKGYLIVEQLNVRNNSFIPSNEKSELLTCFSFAISMYCSLEMLERHGIHNFIKSLSDENNDYKFFVKRDPKLRSFALELQEKYGKIFNDITSDQQISDYGHPKFEMLKTKILEYFDKEGNKAIIFCEFRDSTILINAVLKQLRPRVKPGILIGQGGEMKQKHQLAIMKEFREGKINTLICTCVAEEGLDIGEVDLVVCFDISTKNATRFVQRIGRTGRKRNGQIVVLASEGRELQMIKDLIHKKDSINKSITRNKSINNFLYKGPSLFPKGFNPKCLETKFNIESTSTQNDDDNEDENAGDSKKTKNKNLKSKVTATKGLTSIKNHFKPVKKIEEEKMEIEEVVEIVDVEEDTNDVNEINEINKLVQNFQIGIANRLDEIKDKKMVHELLKYRLEKRVSALKDLTSFIATPFNADECKNVKEINFEDIDMSEIKDQHEKNYEEYSRYINPFDVSEMQRNSSFIPVNTDFIIPEHSQISPKSSSLKENNEFGTPIRKLIFNSEINSPLLPFNNHQDEMLASTPVVSKIVNEKKSSPKILKNTFEFLGITSIEDIFEGCSSFSHLKSKDVIADDEIIESSVKVNENSYYEEIIGSSQPSTPVASTKKRFKKRNDDNVFKQFNLASIEDLFNDQSLEKRNSEPATPKSTVENDNRTPEKSQRQVDKKFSPFSAVSISSNESPPKTFIKRRPNITKLVTALKSESFLTQDKPPLREPNTASFKSPTQTLLEHDLKSPVPSTSYNYMSSPATPSTPIASRKRKVKQKRANNFKGFLVTQAADDDDVSSDEEELLDDTMMKNFISNETINAQNETFMYAKYIQSIKSPLGGCGNFKMPLNRPPPINISDIYSQAPELDAVEDEEEGEDMDSFIVGNSEIIEEEEESELDELEIAERRLKEMKNKRRKQNKQDNERVKRRKIIHDSSDEEHEELKRMREELNMI